MIKKKKNGRDNKRRVVIKKKNVYRCHQNSSACRHHQVLELVLLLLFHLKCLKRIGNCIRALLYFFFPFIYCHAVTVCITCVYVIRSTEMFENPLELWTQTVLSQWSVDSGSGVHSKGIRVNIIFFNIIKYFVLLLFFIYLYRICNSSLSSVYITTTTRHERKKNVKRDSYILINS